MKLRTTVLVALSALVLTGCASTSVTESMPAVSVPVPGDPAAPEVPAPGPDERPSDMPGEIPDETPSETPSPTPAEPTDVGSVNVYFTPGDGGDNCEAVEAVSHQIPVEADPLIAALKELVAGPTAAESAAGLTSWFSAETADVVLDASAADGIARVDFTNYAALIPNASSSCGSASLLAQLDATVQGVVGATTQTCYSFEGDLTAFYEWLQLIVPTACQ